LRKVLIVIQEPYRLLSKLQQALESLLGLFPWFRFFAKTRNDEYPIRLSTWFRQKVLGANGAAYWPMHPASLVSYPKNVLIGKGVVPGINPGCYLHAVNGILIGDYTFIAPNVGIMSGNHQLHDLRQQTESGPVRIGKYCWIGMNAMILPAVELGDFTIVAAGAIVTKSFPQGHCVLAGNPAVQIKALDPEKCLRYEIDFAYIGYIPSARFDDYRKKNLNI